MAFTSTKTFAGYPRLKFSMGTYTNGAGDTGGTIDSGLKAVFFVTTSTGSHTASGAPKVTWSGSTITIVTDTDSDGYWFAVGI